MVLSLSLRRCARATEKAQLLGLMGGDACGTRGGCAGATVGRAGLEPHRVVRVEEIVIVVLVTLPAVEEDANDHRDPDDEREQRRLVSAERLR